MLVNTYQVAQHHFPLHRPMAEIGSASQFILFAEHYFGDHIMKDGMGETCNTHRGDNKFIHFSFKSEG
jgi:hypothetical protein